MANYTSLASLSPTFILPEDMRPQLSEVSTLASIPIIDLGEDLYAKNGDRGMSGRIVHQISKACEEYGFFQIINHGVPQELCKRMLTASTEFFNLPPEEKAQYFSTDHTKQVRLFNYDLKLKEGDKNIKMWSEVFAHHWHLIDNSTHLLPQNPRQYRYNILLASFCILNVVHE